MIELAALATSIVSSFLLPLAKDGAKALRDRLASKAGEASADKLVGTAETLWSRVRGSAKPGAEQGVLDTFEQNPDLLKEAVEKIVLEQLKTDQAFRDEATTLLEAEAAPGTTSWQLMGDVVGAIDLRGSTISGGTFAGVNYQAPAPTAEGTDPAVAKPTD